MTGSVGLLSDAAESLGNLAAAVVALLLSLAFYFKLRAVRKAQLVLLGTGKDDLVNFAVSLQTRIDDLHRVVDEGVELELAIAEAKTVGLKEGASENFVREEVARRQAP